MNTIERLFLKHKTWCEIVRTFGCNNETAEDIVQEMYIKLLIKINNGLDITYNDDDVNYYYVFKTLKSLFLDLKRREKNVNMIGLEFVAEIPSGLETIGFEQKYIEIENELNDMYWYDQKIYILIDDGISISELSRQTLIPYYSLYNTFRKVKKKLKSIL
jgi:DNA-directed RNA polymerase specialized sigma24 family protein